MSAPFIFQATMDNLYINETKQTPKVNFLRDGKLEISGLSFPELVDKFYAPIFEWLDVYIQQPQKETTLKLKMDYYNKPSSKKIFDILRKMEHLHNKGHVVEIFWYYQEDDVDMEEDGKDYALCFKMPFIIKAIKT